VEKSFFLFVVIVVMIIVMLVVMMIVVVVLPLRIGSGRHFQCRTLDHLFQLAPVQPYTSTFRTIINLYALTIRYGQWDVTNGTIHDSSSLSVKLFIATCALQKKHKTNPTGFDLFSSSTIYYLMAEL